MSPDETEDETALQTLQRHYAAASIWIVRHSRPQEPARLPRANSVTDAAKG
jgi:hypothetical protein